MPKISYEGSQKTSHNCTCGCMRSKLHSNTNKSNIIDPFKAANYNNSNKKVKK